VAVRPVDRPEYVLALQRNQAGLGSEQFDKLLYQRLDATVDEALAAGQTAVPPGPETQSTSDVEQLSYVIDHQLDEQRAAGTVSPGRRRDCIEGKAARLGTDLRHRDGGHRKHHRNRAKDRRNPPGGLDVEKAGDDDCGTNPAA
jgi:hypothetical protein